MALATPTAISSIYGPAQDDQGTETYTLRAAAVLTTGFVASDHMPVRSPITSVFVTYASVDYTSIETLPEISLDGVTFFAIPDTTGATDYNGSAWTLANFESATTQTFVIRVNTQDARYLRIKIKRTGGSAVGTVALVGFSAGRS